MKFTEKQKDLLAFLPTDLKKSKDLTDSSKLVLSNIIFLYGMDDAQKNGYVYRSYDDIMNDTLIKSKTSISRAIALLVIKGFIKVRSGRWKDRKANEFMIVNSTLLNKKCTEKCTEENKKCTEKCTEENKKCTEKCTEENEKCTEKCTEENEKCTEKCTEENEYWTKKIENLENEIVLLKKRIEDLEKCTEKCTTDTDTDIETDIEIYKDFSTCSKSTCNNEEKNIKEKNIKKEMKDKNLFKNSQNTMQTNTNAQAINSPSKEEIISKAINNINLDKSSMFRAKTQTEYNAALKDLKHQLKKIQDNTSIEAYKNYRAGLAKWYRASVQHMKFAQNKAQKVKATPTQQTDEDVCLQQPKVYLVKNIKPIDVKILQYWVDERNKANAQEQKDKAQNMIDALLLKWQETYEAETILKVCQEYHLFAAGEPQTTMVEQQPTKQKTTQYKPLEEECGDFVTDNHQVYYIKPQSTQMAN